MPLSLQGKLLRVIQEKEFRRVGSDKYLRTDVRIISSTNENLDSLIRDKKFRNDLYYRISTLSITLQNLNKRKEDIIPLSELFLERYTNSYNYKINKFTENEKDMLLNFQYKGNVRQLENIIHRFVLLFPVLKRKSLLLECMDDDKEFINTNIENKIKEFISLKKDTLLNMEKEIINIFLYENSFNRQVVAEKLDISRSTLYRKMKQ